MFRIAVLSLALAGCAGKPVIETKVIDKLVPVHCKVEMPAECRDSYAVDRVSPADDALTINRALRAEIEERWACEIKLRAAVKGCNQGLPEAAK
ncbi:hypothetical protein SAMN05216316_1046 [Nitrosovibrio sp. Nv6]|nr:hypothetical protein SAMN05216316_1046 [Nitrosovibrio sp. Nv6]